jgi:hypothetical protein
MQQSLTGQLFFDLEQVFVADFLALSRQPDKLDWHSAIESAN